MRWGCLHDKTINCNLLEFIHLYGIYSMLLYITYGLMITKLSSTIFVFILENCPIRKLYKLNMVL